MSIRLLVEPNLDKPDMIACWPGIGNIGVIAVDALRAQLQAEELGEIEPWEFFNPRKVSIRASILRDMEFSSCKFYYKRLADRDLILFIAEEQPTEFGKMYAEGKKACKMANLVLDVAERFRCRRVYTSGAAVAFTHHRLKPRVWAVGSTEDIISQIRHWENTILMSKVENMGTQGTITGLNGLLLGFAKKRGFEAVCLMGEIPDYLSAVPFPYPSGSKSVLEVLARILKIEVSPISLDQMSMQMNQIIDDLYEKWPAEIRERLDQRLSAIQPKPEAITEEDQKWIKEHIDELFKKKGGGDERPS